MSTESKPMSEADQKELERLRAAEAERQRQAEEAAKNPPKTQAEQMKDDYIHNRGTIQTIARHYRVTVDEVLVAIGQGDMAQIDTMGDLIDSADLGPDDKPKASGTPAKVPFDLK